MNELIVKNVSFCGAELLAVQEKETGKIYAGINSVLRELGFDEKQIEYRRDKWKTDKVLKKGTLKFSGTLLGVGTGKDVWCIEIKKLPLALAKLEITPRMEKEMPELTDKLEKYQEACADVLAEAFLSKTKRDKPKKEKLQSVNKAVSNIDRIFTKAGIEPIYIAAEAKRLYSEAGYEINIPLITDNTMQKLWDCTSIAKELGITSESGRPHDKAVSAIIQKLDIFENEVVRTAYSRNGHDGVTVQYKDSVFSKVKEWLEENGYPTVVELRLSNGNINKCRVVYCDVA